MKAINCRNVQRFVANHNKEIIKNQQSSSRSNLTIESILGTNSEQVKGKIIYCLNNEEVLYFSDEYFIVQNIISKQTQIIPRRSEGDPTKTILIDRFQTKEKHTLIVTIELINNNYHIGQLIIKDKIINRNALNTANYQWKTCRLTNRYTHQILSIHFHPQKQYLYLLSKKEVQGKFIRYLWAFDLLKEALMLNAEIKPNITKVQIERVWVTEQYNEVYLIGKNYLRFWTINYNEKSMKESNYRNIERSLYNKTIVNIFWIFYQGANLLSILTENSLLLLKRNELFSLEQPSSKAFSKSKNKENIEVELQNSLNQIHKMKFLFEEEQCNVKDKSYFSTPSNTYQQGQLFCCSTNVWSNEGEDHITVATKSGNILTFLLTNGQLKLTNQLTARKPHHFDYLDASRNGSIIIFSQNHCQNLYIVNKYSINAQESEEDMHLFWGMGQITKENICSMDSPALHRRFFVLGEDATFRLWGFKVNERKIIFQQKLTCNPTMIALHPCGNLVALKCPRQIKLMSILPQSLFEVVSIRTNYNPIDIKYSKCGNYLVSNQENILIFYNPFTLKNLGYIECPHIKCTILNFQITPEAQYIVYQSSDYALYVQMVNLHNPLNRFDQIKPSHTQIQPYTCFYFYHSDIDSNKSITQNQNGNLSNQNGYSSSNKSYFIGFGKQKYIVLYEDMGKQLIAQFAVEDCYVENICVEDGWLFAATSSGKIRVYKWPISESDLELQIISTQTKKAKYKPPKYEQFNFWNGKRIKKMHKLAFSKEIVVTHEEGRISILSYESNEKRQDPVERKKLIQSINDTFFITKADCDKRNRLIEKTQTDILKVENQISKQKNTLERKYEQECYQLSKNHIEKTELQMQQKNEYLKNIQRQISQLKAIIQQQRLTNKKHEQQTLKFNQSKKDYQLTRNLNLQRSNKKLVEEHKLFIVKKMEEHKDQIKNIKMRYQNKLKEMQRDFCKMIQQDQKMSQVIKTDYALEFPIQEEDIKSLNQKLEEVRNSNKKLSDQLNQIKQRTMQAEIYDEKLQREFQRKLQLYNTYRFKNLNLHSQILKMRTQLIERKQIMENKQTIIKTTYLQRLKLQNYKEMVKGALIKLQNRKQHIYKIFVDKQGQVQHIFSQLSTNCHILQSLKQQSKRLNALQQIYDSEKKNWEARVKVAVSRLKQLKRYLLLQGLNQDAERKKMYNEQQNLLGAIAFYKKRMNMEMMKEKKNTGLKRSAVNLILKQNKNLLEECNKLREQATLYNHEVKNLNAKLSQTNKIIEIQTKLKEQKDTVGEQRKDLETIRDLFNKQIASYNFEMVGEVDFL